MTSEDALLAVQVALVDVPSTEQPYVIATAIALALERIQDNWPHEDAAEVLARLLALTSTQVADGPPSYQGANTPVAWARELITQARELA